MKPDLSLYHTTARSVGIPARLLLAVAQAESEFSPYAERWGVRTMEAIRSLTVLDQYMLTEVLAEVLATEWPDVSFGVGQMIVRWHYIGDQTPAVSNVLYVRETVFGDPVEDLRQVALRLRWYRGNVLTAGPDLTPVNGDIDLATAIAYNSGHYPPARPYWLAFSANVRRYREALERWS